MKKLSKKKLEKYVAEEGMVCPCCGSRDIEEYDSGLEGRIQSYVLKNCNDCGALYTETYSIVSVEVNELKLEDYGKV